MMMMMMMMTVFVQIATTLNCLNVQWLSITFYQGILCAEHTDTIAVDRQMYSSVSLLTLVINIVMHVMSITNGNEHLITTDSRMISQC